MRQNRRQLIADTRNPGAKAAATIAKIKVGQLVYFQGLNWTGGTGHRAYFNVPESAVVERVTRQTVFVSQKCQSGITIHNRLTGVQLSHGRWFATFAAYKAHHEEELREAIKRAQKELAALEAFQPPTAKQVLKLVG